MPPRDENGATSFLAEMIDRVELHPSASREGFSSTLGLTRSFG